MRVRLLNNAQIGFLMKILVTKVSMCFREYREYRNSATLYYTLPERKVSRERRECLPSTRPCVDL